MSFLDRLLGEKPDIARKSVISVLVILTVYFIAWAAFSLIRWKLLLDSPIMLYISWLIKHYDMIPYKDIYDFNMPGVYAFYSLFIWIFGTSDIGFRIGDFAYLLTIMAFTWLWMKRFGDQVAWTGSIVFGIVYLMGGPNISVQREFIILLPLIIAMYLVTKSIRLNSSVKQSVIGLLFGLAFIIKPHAAIGFPLVIVYILYDLKESPENIPIVRSSRRIIPIALAGFLMPLIVGWLYLSLTGALEPFLEMVRNYWPLYNDLTGDHMTIWSTDKYLYMLSGFLNIGNLKYWLVPSVIGIYFIFTFADITRPMKKQAILLIIMMLSYSVYPIFAAKFWPYHWLPMLYFLVQLSALCLIENRAPGNRFSRLFPIIIYIIFLLPGITPSDNMLRSLLIPDINRSDTGFMGNVRAAEIANFLEKNLNEGDLVQPLDWTGGAVHGMLMAKAKIATPFVYDFYFYHHVSRPYIQYLRKKFMIQLAAARPRFIIQILDNKPWPYGYDTTREFPELKTFIETNYVPVARGQGYFIYGRK